MQRVFLLFAAIPLAAAAQQYGTAPAPALGATDVISAFKLPPLRDPQLASGLQVTKRAAILGLTGQSPIDAWNSAQLLLASSTGSSMRTQTPTAFSGTTASALNQLLATAISVRVVSPILTIDQPIELQRSGTTLDLGSAQLMSAPSQPYMLRIERASNVTVLHGSFILGDSAILINAANGVSISGVQITGLKGAGIVVTGSTHVNLANNQIENIGLAGIMLHRGTAQSIVRSNLLTNNLGSSNVTAAIVLTDREVDLTQNPRAIFGPSGYWVVGQPMLQRLNPPHDNVIYANQVIRNNASGIYSDGAVRNVIVSNTIQSNAKEGLCLDNGSTANVVASNILQDNGDRWGENDNVLTLDYILGGGRLADGTPVEKVPGISIDNALYNVVFSNTVSHNYGGGVKIVRTGYFNLIGLNTLVDNNDGASAGAHFFGIELGAAAGDDASNELDFVPSRGNIVFSNNIRGTHYSGIFFDAGSDQNDVLNNVIFDAQNWALESAAIMQNNSVNNLTSLPSRNIGSGLAAALVTSGQPVNDPPPANPPPM